MIEAPWNGKEHTIKERPTELGKLQKGGGRARLRICRRLLTAFF